MVSGTGIDLVCVARFRREQERRAENDFHDLFTRAEQAEFLAMPDRALGHAAVFASKEAVFKAIGTGKLGRMSWLDIEIGHADGRYTVALGGETASVAQEAGVHRVHLSLTHVDGQIVAWAVAEDRR